MGNIFRNMQQLVDEAKNFTKALNIMINCLIVLYRQKARRNATFSTFIVLYAEEKEDAE